MSVLDSVSKLRLGKIESRTHSRNGDSEIYSLGLGLQIETQKIWVSDSVSQLRLWKIQFRSQSQNWDSENLSLGPGLKIETLKIPVSDSVSKCKSWSRWSLWSFLRHFYSPPPPENIEMELSLSLAKYCEEVLQTQCESVLQWCDNR